MNFSGGRYFTTLSGDSTTLFRLNHEQVFSDLAAAVHFRAATGSTHIWKFFISTPKVRFEVFHCAYQRRLFTH